MSHYPLGLLALAALMLTGCSAPQSEQAQLTLVETKAPVQLMRNAAAARVPADAIGFVSNSGDASVECGDGDPYRLWSSSVNLTLTTDEAPRAREHYDELVANYVADGWTVDDEQSGSTHLIREEGEPELVIIVQDYTAISVTVNGECVLTDGEGSAEVKALEDAGD